MEYEDEVISETISGKFEVGLDLQISFVDIDTYLVNSGVVKSVYEKFLLSSLFGQSLCVDMVCYDLSFVILLYVLTNSVFFFDFIVGTAMVSAISSLTSLAVGNVWLERLVYDLFGMNFLGLMSSRRMMTDYSFMGHPFKKSFPLLGNVELYYSELDKHTKYKSVDSAELLSVFMLVFKVWY